MPFVAAIVRRCADADPILPARVWRFSGRDLSLADLRKLLDLLDEKSIKPDDFQMNLVTTQLRAWEVQVGSSERDRAHKMQGRKLHA
jgi:hypothetical protein